MANLQKFEIAFLRIVVIPKSFRESGALSFSCVCYF